MKFDLVMIVKNESVLIFYIIIVEYGKFKININDFKDIVCIVWLKFMFIYFLKLIYFFEIKIFYSWFKVLKCF